MKNFNIDKLKQLPFKESMYKSSDNNDPWHWSGTSDYHRVDNYFPSTTAERVLDKFVGKHVNKAFSYYCTLVPKYQQQWFWEEIEKDRRAYWHWRRPGYYIDNGNNIRKQKKNNPPRKYVYIGEEDIVTKNVTYFHKSHPKYGKRLPPIEENIDSIAYEKKYYQGTKGYARTMAEKQQHKMNKEVIEDYYDFNRIKREKKANEEDEAIRNRHGFDETSFIGEEYHGQKRKREKKKNK